MISLPAASTALVLIDLQRGIVGRALAPRSGDAVVAGAKALATRFRAAAAPVVLVNVGFALDSADALRAPVDQPMKPPPGGFAPDWMELVDGLATPSDLRVTKRQWGAFYGTELDLQLRRRGVTTIVLGGIAPNMGVESTGIYALSAHRAPAATRPGETPWRRMAIVPDGFPPVSGRSFASLLSAPSWRSSTRPSSTSRSEA